MSTPASGPSYYAAISDWLIRYDWRSIAQLVSDTGIPIASPAQLIGPPPNPTLTAFLMEAAGLVESACTQAGAYVIDPTSTPPINDLAILNNNSQQLLIGLVVNLAMWKLWLRRPIISGNLKMPAQCEEAVTMLDALAKGERIFGILEHQKAGQLHETTDQPPDFWNRRGLVVQARPYFGRRSTDMPVPLP